MGHILDVGALPSFISDIPLTQNNNQESLNNSLGSVNANDNTLERSFIYNKTEPNVD